MYDTNEIRESLMRIKKSQSDLLKELKSEHDALQGYMTSNQVNYEPYKNRNSTYSSHQSRQSFQSSLDISKSLGNLSNQKTKYVYNSTTTGADQILQTNYKKIEQLLVKQRKLYDENHILQQENQSLLQDYRQLKKMLYQSKQAQKNIAIIINYLLNQIIYPSFRQVLLEAPNINIASKVNKNWNKFKVDHPKLFNGIVKSQNFTEDMQSFLQKLFGLLGQEFKLNTIKTKQQQIEELKYKISQLINMNTEVTKNKEDILQVEEKRHIFMQVENSKLGERIKILQKQLVDYQRENLAKFKKFQNQIISKDKQIQRISDLVKDKQQQVKKVKQKFVKQKNQRKAISQKADQLQKNFNIASQKLRQKQQMYRSQVQLNRKQNMLIQKLGRDMTEMRINLQGTSQKRNQNQNRLFIENDNLKRQLNGIRNQFNKYRQSAQKQISSLLNHNKQIRSQHSLLIKSQQNARVNEMRFRQMVATRQTQMNLTSNIDHLWSVKQIQYQNIMRILDLSK